MHFEDSVVSVSVLGYDVFTPTRVKSKGDIFASGIFVPTRVESKGGRPIEKIGAQIPYFISKLEAQFYSYSRSNTLPQSLQQLYFHQKYD